MYTKGRNGKCINMVNTSGLKEKTGGTWLETAMIYIADDGMNGSTKAHENMNINCSRPTTRAHCLWVNTRRR